MLCFSIKITPRKISLTTGLPGNFRTGKMSAGLEQNIEREQGYSFERCVAPDSGVPSTRLVQEFQFSLTIDSGPPLACVKFPRLNFSG